MSLKIGTSHYTPQSGRCLSCGKAMDGATSVTAPGREEARRPKAGDIAVCIYCGHVMAFDVDLKLREINDVEAHSVAGNKNILELQKARGYAMRELNEKGIKTSEVDDGS